MSQQDETLQRILGGFRLYCQSEQTEGRRQLSELWEELGPAGNAYHRCVLAHFMADAQDDPAEELAWDLRALEVAEGVNDGDPAAGQIRTFLPSLHLNLADGYRKQGDFDRAQHHINRAAETGDVLGVDPYGQTVRAGLIRVEAQVAERDSGPPVVFDFD